MKKITLTILGLVLGFSMIQAQDTSDQEEDLISSYYNDDFQPFAKNNWFVGLSFSLTDDKTSNTAEVFGFDRIITRDIFDYSFDVKAGYFFSKNSMVLLGYEYADETTDSQVRLLSDTLFSTKTGQLHSISPSIRTYFALTKNRRLSLFNEFNLSLGFGNAQDGKIENGIVTEVIDTDIFQFGVGLSPGVTFFVVENFAFEIQLDVLGYKYEQETIQTNAGEETTRTSNNIDFTLSLLSLEFGLAYYIR